MKHVSALWVLTALVLRHSRAEASSETLSSEAADFPHHARAVRSRGTFLQGSGADLRVTSEAPQHEALQGGIVPPEARALFYGTAVAGVLSLIVIPIIYGVIVRYSISERKKEREGRSGHTWFVLDSSEARSKLEEHISDFVWLTDKRLFALLMHLEWMCPATSDPAERPASRAEEAVLGAARDAGVAEDVMRRLSAVLREGQGAPARVPATFLVQGGAGLAIPGTGGVPGVGGDSMWFLKGADSDCGNNNLCLADFEECVQKTLIPCGKMGTTGLPMEDALRAHLIWRQLCKDSYVAQPHVPRPMLVDGRKFDLRLHVVVLAPGRGNAGSAAESIGPLQAFLFKEAIMKLARDPWGPEKLSTESQHTNMHGAAASSSFHQRLLCGLPDGEEILQNCAKEIEACLRAYRVMLHHGSAAAARQIFGLDVMVDEDRRAWVIEWNFLPGDDPHCLPSDIYEAAYMPIKRDLPMLASKPLLEGRRATVLDGWQELYF